MALKYLPKATERTEEDDDYDDDLSSEGKQQVVDSIIDHNFWSWEVVKEGFLQPFRRTPEAYWEIAAQGWESMQQPGKLNKALGGLQYLTAAIQAPYRAFVGEPAKSTALQAGASERMAEIIGQTAEMGAAVFTPGAMVGKALLPKTGQMLTPATGVAVPKWWVRFWNPYGLVPQEVHAIASRADVKGKKSVIDSSMRTLFKRLEKFDTEQAKEGFRALDGKIPIADIEDEVLRKTIVELRKKLDGVGYGLMKRGLISKGQYTKMKGNYVPYLIGKHFFDEDEMTRLFTQSGRLNRKYAKARSTHMTYEQRQAIGLIEDFRQAVPFGMGRALTDIVKFDFHKKVAMNPKWSLGHLDADIPGIGRKSLLELNDEIAALEGQLDLIKQGKIPVSEATRTAAKAAPKVAGRLELESPVRKLIETTDLAEPGNWIHPAKAAEGAAREFEIYPMFDRLNNLQIYRKELMQKIKMNDVADDFRLMPESKAWGKLSNNYVRKEIYDDLMPLSPIFSIKAQEHPIFDVLLKLPRTGVLIFKEMKVALNLPTATRNIGSNILQYNMKGHSLPHVFKSLVSGTESVIKNDEWYKLAKRAGLFETNWATGELSEVYDELLDVVKGGTSLERATASFAKLGKYYGKIDDIVKLSLFKDEMLRHGDKEKAVYEALKWGMDYSLAPRSIKRLRRGALPFISYTYKISPLIYETMKHRPWIIPKYQAAIVGLAAYSVATNKMTADEWYELRRKLPHFIRENRSLMIIPHKSKEGNWEWINAEYFFPWGNALSITRDLSSGQINEIFKSLGVNPYLDVAIALGGKEPKDTFTGQPIYDPELDSVDTQMRKSLQYIYQKFAPGMLLRFATNNPKKPVGALGTTEQWLKGEKDEWGRTTDWYTAFGKWFGVNVATYPEAQVITSKKGRIDKITKETYRRLYRAKTDQQRDKVIEDYQRATQEIYNPTPGTAIKTQYRLLKKLSTSGIFDRVMKENENEK